MASSNRTLNPALFTICAVFSAVAATASFLNGREISGTFSALCTVIWTALAITTSTARRR